MPAPNPLRPALFRFLTDLAAHNDRTWFKAHQQRYEDEVREPARAFITQFGPFLEALSEHFVADARKVGGSLFRIQRDTRFSKDKSPYKINTGLHFRHESAKDAHAPGYYLHLEPKQIFVGLGIWHPDTATAGRIRAAIADDPKGWKKVTGSAAFKRTFELAGDSLKRPPRGYDPEHPAIEDLKRKDFIGTARLTQKQVTAPDFAPQLAKTFRTGTPLVQFLCRALDLPA
jgi:uncharacterized protein (TIGR02453 family)